MNNPLECNSLFTFNSYFFKNLFSRYTYPWEIFPDISSIIDQLVKEGLDGYHLACDGVLIGKDVTISESAEILPPAIIGSGSELRHSAFLRGHVILGEGCVVGNSSEIKRSVVMDGAKLPHFNYVGDSVIGEGAHLGAGVICSNLRLDKSTVTVKIGEERINTGLRKLGAIIGDECEIGCSAVLSPGSVIAKGATVYPLESVSGYRT